MKLVYRCSLGVIFSLVSWGISQASERAADAEAEFNRTTYCVYGGLPIEVRYSLPGKPHLLAGSQVTKEDIGRLSTELDVKIQGLLKQAGGEAWKKVTHGSAKVEWSRHSVDELNAEFSDRLARIAPRGLGLEFCGDSTSVGNTVLTSLASYFLRATRTEDGRDVDWLKDAGDSKENARGLVMLATALHLAGIDVPLEKVLHSRR